jgi:flagellar motor switch protein FliN
MSKATAQTSGEEELDRAINELRGVLKEDASPLGAPSFGADMPSFGDDVSSFGAPAFDASGMPSFGSPETPSFGGSPISDFGEDTGPGAQNSGIIMTIPVDVQIVLGTAEMQVSELMALRKGATVALDRRIGEPVDVVVNGRKVARGEITVLDSDPTRFGIRLTEIISDREQREGRTAVSLGLATPPERGHGPPGRCQPGHAPVAAQRARCFRVSRELAVEAERERRLWRRARQHENAVVACAGVHRHAANLTDDVEEQPDIRGRDDQATARQVDPGALRRPGGHRQIIPARMADAIAMARLLAPTLRMAWFR